MKRSSMPLLVFALATVTLASALSTRANAADQTSEAVAGGLSFAANPSIRIEQQDVLVTADKITVTYTLRNDATSQQVIYVSFALPDLEANAVVEGEVSVTATEPLNFVQATTLVDGQPVALRTEQRALAIGLDVTSLITAAGIPPLPLIDNLSAKLDALSPAQRLELLERGVLKEEGTVLAPAWSVKTISYWRQSFAPEQTLTIQHSYRPIGSTIAYRADAMASLRKRACVTTAQENAIAKLTMPNGVAPTLTSVTFGATANADALGPVRRFRLIVETGDPLTIIASCREGLRQTGPMQFDWNATDYVPDEEFQLLFAR